MKNCIIAFLYLVASVGCSSDDNATMPTTWEGTVLGTISCHNDSTDLIYEIEVTNHSSLDRIGAPNIPEKFKVNGLKINFELGSNSMNVSSCVSLYSPDYFYNIYNVNKANPVLNK